MHIEQRFLLSAVIVFVCLFLLAGALVFRAEKDLQRLSHLSDELNGFRLLLTSANNISAERGPANNAMAADIQDKEEATRALDEIRLRVDNGLNQISTLSKVDSSLMEKAREDLASARRGVDEVRLTPLNQRTISSIETAIKGMFTAWNSFRDVVRLEADRLLAQDNEIFPAIFVGMAALEFRDLSGRAATSLIAPLALHRPIPASNLTTFYWAKGQLEGLWGLTDMPTALLPNQTVLAGFRNDMDHETLHRGIDMIQGLIDEGRDTGKFSLNVTEFTKGIVATFQPVLRLQSATIDVLELSLRQKIEKTRLVLISTVSTVLALLMITAAAVIYVQTRLFAPLILARAHVMALAADEEPRRPAPFHALRQFGELFTAIDTLAAHLQERQSLTHDLRRAALVDGLTGVMNRRALETRIAQLSEKRLMPQTCLILIDVDKFKAINDTYGHGAGDYVVQKVAQHLGSLVRSSDMIARFGGDEFVVLIANAGLDLGRRIAEDMRRAIVSADWQLPDGRDAGVITATFGVAAGAEDWPGLLAQADAALYQAKNNGRNAVATAGVASSSRAGEHPATAA